jgi:hypothetical protein
VADPEIYKGGDAQKKKKQKTKKKNIHVFWVANRVSFINI